MTRNRVFSETELITGVVEQLRARIPPTWKLDIELEPAGRFRPDACLKIEAPDGTTATIIVEAKSGPIRPTFLIDQLRRYAEMFPRSAPLGVTPYLSLSARALLTREGISYADATGNLRLRLDKPALFIETAGADRDPWPDDQPLRSLRGAAAGRAVRAFCDFTPPYGTRELADRAGVPAPTLSRVAELLEREGILGRERNRGPIMTVDWQAALRRWVQDYAFARSNRTSSWLEPRGLPALLARLREAGYRYAITGSLAATAIAPITEPRLAAVYVDDGKAVARTLGLRAAESGANVLLAEPFDAVAFARGFEQEGLRYAAYSQVAADLMTGPGRWPAEGEAVLGWMQAHEPLWRA